MSNDTLEENSALELIWQNAALITEVKYHKSKKIDSLINGIQERLYFSLANEDEFTRDFGLRNCFIETREEIINQFDKSCIYEISMWSEKLYKASDSLLMCIKENIRNNPSIDSEKVIMAMLSTGYKNGVSYFQDGISIENPSIKLKSGEILKLPNYWLNNLIAYRAITNRYVTPVELDKKSVLELINAPQTGKVPTLVKIFAEELENILLPDFTPDVKLKIENIMKEGLCIPMSHKDIKMDELEKPSLLHYEEITIAPNKTIKKYKNWTKHIVLQKKKLEVEPVNPNQNSRTYTLYKPALSSTGNYSLTRDNQYKYATDIAYAVSDKGLCREINEDSYHVVFHPSNPDFSLSVIADGVGGSKNGEEASLYATRRLGMYFEESTLEEINDSCHYSKKILDELKNISDEIATLNINGETTLTCAIKNTKQTIIANVGDSRAYVYDGENLKQVTRDDSDVYLLYEDEKIKKDDIRYLENNNVITNDLGHGNENIYPTDVNVLDNEGIKGILLTTDGVTDIVSDNSMEAVFNENFQTNPENICKKIIDKAVYGEYEKISSETRNSFAEAGYYYTYRTRPGKDNATLVLSLYPKR